MTTPSLVRRPTPQTLALLALVGVTLLWSTSFVAAKVALADLPPATLGLLRCAIASLAFQPFLRRGNHPPVTARGRAPVLLGLTGVVVPLVAHNLALRWCGAAESTLTHGGAFPVLTGLLAVLLLRERLGPWPLAGLAASLVGVVAVATGAGARGSEAALGGGLLLLGTGAMAVYTVAGRRAFAATDWLAALAASFRASTYLLVPIAAVELAIVGLPEPSLPALLAMAYLGLGCSALALWLNAVALQHIEAGRVAIIGNLEIPLGIAAGALLLGEAVGPAQLLGATLVAGGALLAARGERRSAGVVAEPSPSSGAAPRRRFLDLVARFGSLYPSPVWHTPGWRGCR